MTHNRFFDEHQRETVAARHGLDDPDHRHAGRTGGGDRIGDGSASHRPHHTAATRRLIPARWRAEERPTSREVPTGPATSMREAHRHDG